MPRAPTGNGDPEALAALERDQKGRITKSRGRPKGAVWRPETRRKHDLLKAMGFDGRLGSVLQLLPMAQENLGGAVKRGDPTATQWVLNLAHRQTREMPLQRALPGCDLTTIDGVVDTGRRVMEMLAAGEIPLAQADQFMEVCRGYIQLQGVAEVARLQEMLDTLEDERNRGAGPKVEQTLPNDMLPQWGGLQKVDNPAVTGHNAPPETDEALLRASILE